MADPFDDFRPAPDSLGTSGAVVTPNNSTDINPVAKALLVTDTSGGDVLRFLPVNNADSGWITITGVLVGYSPPYRVRRVHTDTTCTVASVDG